MIAFSCPTPGCNGRQQLTDDLAGATVICPECLQLVRVPGGPPPSAASKPASGPISSKPASNPPFKPQSSPPVPVVPPPTRITTPRSIPSPITSDSGPKTATTGPVASGGHKSLPPSHTQEARRWFYELNGSPCGPVAEVDLAVLAKDERILPHTLVWCAEQSLWQPAGGMLPRLFKGATADDLRPPTPGWQKWMAIGLVCVAMAAVMGAALTFVLTGKKKGGSLPTTAVNRGVHLCQKVETISQPTPGQPDPEVRT